MFVLKDSDPDKLEHFLSRINFLSFITLAQVVRPFLKLIVKFELKLFFENLKEQLFLEIKVLPLIA